jgi:hypothetical protein
MKEDFFNWYKKGFDNLPPTEPPPMVWENIASALDGKTKRRIPAFWWLSGLSTLVIGLATASWMNYSPINNEASARPVSIPNPIAKQTYTQNQYSVSKQIEQSNTENSVFVKAENLNKETNNSLSNKKQAALINQFSNSKPIALETANSSSTVESNTTNSQSNQTVSRIQENITSSILFEEEAIKPIDNQLSQSQTFLTKSSGINLLKRPFTGFLPSTINSELTATTQQLPELIIPKMNNSGSTWFFGVASEINNNWVFNHDLVDAMRKESMNSILPHFSSTHSLVASKEFLPNQRIRAELILSKIEGQHFVQYENGQLVRKNLHLNYSGVTLLYDYQNPSAKNLFGLALRTHWLGGVSLCYLSESKLAIGQTLVSPSGYRKMNISLVAGMEKEVFLTRQLSLGAGLRLTGGLTNIFKGYENIPSWFNRTHTGNIAGTLSVRYYLNIPNH